MSSLIIRRSADRLVKCASFLATLIGVFFLCWILYTVISIGGKSLSWEFFTNPTKPYGIPNGGVLNALVGTLAITLGATLIGLPLGLLAGIYLSEFGRSSKLSNFIRFTSNVMMGLPSIIIGLFVYSLFVVNLGHFSGFAGSIALAIIMFPVITRTTEDMLNMVPNALRESALALGMPRWRATLDIIFRAAKGGLVTGVLLSIARVSGETAPLLFTALWSDNWPSIGSFFSQPTANLTVTITEYATNSPFQEIQNRAWGAALIITISILVLNVLTRFIFREQNK